MRDGIYQVTRGTMCAGFIVENGKVTRIAPILRRYSLDALARLGVEVCFDGKNSGLVTRRAKMLGEK